MRAFLCLCLLTTLASGTADAAPVKRKLRRPAPKITRPAPASPVRPAFPTTPGIMVPRAVFLNKPTAAEARSHAVWSLRAALNVAALQCQYSPYLRTVDNYNQMLRKHSGELATAQTMMIGHFTRTMRGGGMTAFDRYNTRSYNSFSTLDAQYNFCWNAAQAGLALRLANVGQMAAVAEQTVPIIRAALAYVPAAAGLQVPPMEPLPEFRVQQVSFIED